MTRITVVSDTHRTTGKGDGNLTFPDIDVLTEVLRHLLTSNNHNVYWATGIRHAHAASLLGVKPIWHPHAGGCEILTEKMDKVIFAAG